MNATPRQRQTLKRDLAITAWNANCVSDKHPELLEFVARHKPDVLLLGETHLIPGKGFRLPNYVCYRDDRVGPQGGSTAIAVRVSLRHHWVSLPQRQHLECTTVELHRAIGGLLMVSAYKPPSRELLSQDLDVVFGAHRRVVMVGDLCKHSDWGSRTANANGRRLQ